MSHISIVIRTKNEESSIGKTLHSLFHQKAGYSFEVIVVDSGSTDRTLEIVRQYGVKIMQILPEEFTYGFSLNHGIRGSSGEIVCLLSAHCIPASEQWLSELIRPILDGTAHATYGRQVPMKGINPFEEVSFSKHFPENERKTGRVPFSNANSAFLRKMWEQVQFDEALASWEDYLWYMLLKDAYIFKYCPEAVVSHTHPFSMRNIIQRRGSDGRAFRIMKDQYGIDVFNSLYPGIMAKIKMVADDMISHARFFRENGYNRYILLIPFVRIFSYFIYWKEYRSAR